MPFVFNRSDIFRPVGTYQKSARTFRTQYLESSKYRIPISTGRLRGKTVTGGFYEYELYRIANPEIYLVKKMLCKKGNKIYVKWLKFDNRTLGYTRIVLYNVLYNI